MRLLGVATLLIGLLVVASGAQAATFTTTPSAHSESGAGPFLWGFKSDSEEARMGAVAYKVSTETEWHDCSLTHNIELRNLPDGIYTVEIANDLNTNAAGNQLYSGLYARCFQSPPPPPTSAISVSSMEIGPAPTPVQSNPEPGQPRAPSLT